MTTQLPHLLTALIGRHRHTPDDRDGYGFSRDIDNGTQPMPVPDGVDLIFLTGRTPRGAR